MKKISIKGIGYLIVGLFLFAFPAFAANVSVPQATTKGDLPSGLITGNYQLFHPGADGLFLRASSTSASGLDWATASSSSATLTGGINGRNAYWTSATTLGASSDVFDNGTVSGVNATSSTVNFLIQGTAALIPFQVNTSTGISLFSVQGDGTVLIPGATQTTHNNLLTLTPQTTYSNSTSVGGAFNIDNTLNGREAFVIYNNTNSIRNGGAGLFRMTNASTTYSSGELYVQSTSTSGSDFDLRIDSPNPDIEFYHLTSTTTGAYEIAVPTNQDVIQINSRNAGNSSFETIANFQAYRLGGRECIGCLTNNLNQGLLHIVGSSTIPYLTLGSTAGAADILTVASNGSTTINSLTTGFVKSTSGGNLYVDNTAYQPLLTLPFSVAQGGTGTTTPTLIAGTNVTITGTWPFQTINSTASGTATSTNYWNTMTNGIYNNTGYAVGINTSTAVANLAVQGSSTNPTLPIFTVASSTGTQYLNIRPNSAGFSRFDIGNIDVFTIGTAFQNTKTISFQDTSANFFSMGGVIPAGITITSGTSTVEIAGAAGSGNAGVTIASTSDNNKKATFNVVNLSTPRTYSFPDSAGTFALLEAAQTFSGVNTFSATTTMATTTIKQLSLGNGLISSFLAVDATGKVIATTTPTASGTGFTLTPGLGIYTTATSTTAATVNAIPVTTYTVNNTAPIANTNFHTIQAALDACGTNGGALIILSDPLYAQAGTGLRFKGNSCIVQGSSPTTTITFTGATSLFKTNSAAAAYSNNGIRSLTITADGNASGVVLDASDMSHGTYDNIVADNVGSGVVMNDTQNVTFYNEFSNWQTTTLVKFGINMTSTNPVNDNIFTNFFTGCNSTGCIGLFMNQGNNNKFYGFKAEPANTNNVGIRITATVGGDGVFDNQFYGSYIEANGVGISISADPGSNGGIQRNQFIGGIIDANTIDYSASSTVDGLQTFIGVDNNFGNPLTSFQGPIGIGTTTPAATLSIKSLAGSLFPFFIASSTGSRLFSIEANGSTTISSLGTGCVGASNGSLYIATSTCAGGGVGTGISGSGTSGQVTVWNGSSSVTGDPAYLWDLANHRFSINSSTPNATLTIQGSSTAPSLDLFRVATSTGSTYFQMTNTGRTIIGPGSNPNVNPNIYLLVQGTSDARMGVGVNDRGTFMTVGDASTYGGIFANDYFNGVPLSLALNQFGGKVAIGTTTPIGTFSVVGNAGNINTLVISSSTGVSQLTISPNGSTTLSSLATAGCVASTATGGLYVTTCGSGSVSSVTGSGSILSSGGTTPNITLQNLLSGNILFGQGNNIIGTSTNFAFATSTNTFSVTGTSTISNFLAVGTTTPLIARFTLQNLAGTTDMIRLASSTGSSLTVFNYLGYLGIGTSTPTSNLIVQGIGGQSNPLFTIASSSGTTIFQIISTSTAPTLSIQGVATSNTILQIASSSGTSVLLVDSKGHTGYGGTAPTLTSCNTGTVLANSTDVAGAIIPGTAQTTCTITFATARTNTPFCQVTEEVGTAISIEASATPTTLVITGTTIGGDTISYHCDGN